jgi:hypothetical protein
MFDTGADDAPVLSRDDAMSIRTHWEMTADGLYETTGRVGLSVEVDYSGNVIASQMVMVESLLAAAR